jgi:hypothetical protein
MTPTSAAEFWDQYARVRARGYPWQFVTILDRQLFPITKVLGKGQGAVGRVAKEVGGLRRQPAWLPVRQRLRRSRSWGSGSIRTREVSPVLL